MEKNSAKSELNTHHTNGYVIFVTVSFVEFNVRHFIYIEYMSLYKYFLFSRNFNRNTDLKNYAHRFRYIYPYACHNAFRDPPRILCLSSNDTSVEKHFVDNIL